MITTLAGKGVLLRSTHHPISSKQRRLVMQLQGFKFKPCSVQRHIATERNVYLPGYSHIEGTPGPNPLRVDAGSKTGCPRALRLSSSEYATELQT
eukprot:1571984-Amphidinium_carterae.1